ncbi:MAG TPA: hypothetical protein VJ890_21245 [Vineibacter sp.]|nr:hypothetical protein [Vineibacter sp.]
MLSEPGTGRAIGWLMLLGALGAVAVLVAAVVAVVLLLSSTASAQVRLEGKADCWPADKFLRHVQAEGGMSRAVFADGAGAVWLVIEYPDGSGTLGFMWAERGLFCVLAGRRATPPASPERGT